MYVCVCAQSDAGARYGEAGVLVVVRLPRPICEGRLWANMMAAAVAGSYVAAWAPPLLPTPFARSALRGMGS